jgi:hypothetical protein
MRETGYYWVKFLTKESDNWHVALWDYDHWSLTGCEDFFYDIDLAIIDEKQIKRE